MPEYVSNVEKPVTFAYKDVHFINPECGADGTWRLSFEALTTIAHGLYTRKVHAPIVALNPYGGMEPARAVPTMKEGDHECQYCHMSVKGKDLMQHMAFHIGRGEAKGVCPPCVFCGHNDGACRLQKAKTKSANERWQPASGSCAHHCFWKVSMAALTRTRTTPVRVVVVAAIAAAKAATTAAAARTAVAAANRAEQSSSTTQAEKRKKKQIPKKKKHTKAKSPVKQQAPGNTGQKRPAASQGGKPKKQ